MKRVAEIFILSIITIAWWGTFYPNLSLSRDICKVVYEDSWDREEYNTGDINIFNAKPGQVRVKSRIVEYLQGAF